MSQIVHAAEPNRTDALSVSLCQTETDLMAALGPQGFFERRGCNGVVLVHGVTGAPAEMRGVARALVRRNFTVACPQLEGHCSSVRALKTTRWADWYASVDRAFELLARECDRVFVAGLSVGALLALRLAEQKRERVAGLAVLSATFFFDGWNVPRLKQRLLLPLVLHTPLKYFLSYTEPPPYGIKDERVRAVVAAMYASQQAAVPEKFGYSEFPAVTIAEARRLIRAVKTDLATVAAPTLIVHAVEDDMASLNNARYLEARLGASHIERFDVHDSYHVLTLDRRKDDVAARVSDFFQRASGAAPAFMPAISQGTPADQGYNVDEGGR